jgi:hypothetical protein
MFEQFEQFIKERQFISNVSPRTIEWYRESFQLLDTPDPTPDELKSVADIAAQFEFSSTGKHLPEELNGTAGALLQELKKRLATADPDTQLTIAREARAAWHKVIRQALKVA